MNLKLEKLLTAGFAAALGASFVAANPAEAGIFYDLKNKKMVLLNDGATNLVWTDGRTVSYKSDMGPRIGYPFESGLEKGVNSAGTPYIIFDITDEERRKMLMAHQQNIRQERQLSKDHQFSYLSVTR